MRTQTRSRGISTYEQLIRGTKDFQGNCNGRIYPESIGVYIDTTLAFQEPQP